MATVTSLQPESGDKPNFPPPKSREEVTEIIRAAQEWYHATFPGRDLEAELIAERRAEAANE